MKVLSVKLKALVRVFIGYIFVGEGTSFTGSAFNLLLEAPEVQIPNTLIYISYSLFINKSWVVSSFPMVFGEKIAVKLCFSLGLKT